MVVFVFRAENPVFTPTHTCSRQHDAYIQSELACIPGVFVRVFLLLLMYNVHVFVCTLMMVCKCLSERCLFYLAYSFCTLFFIDCRSFRMRQATKFGAKRERVRAHCNSSFHFFTQCLKRNVLLQQLLCLTTYTQLAW